MERTKDLEKYALPFLVIMYSVGVIGHSFNLTLPIMKILTPYTLLLTGGVVFLFLYRNMGRKFLIWYLVTWALTLIVEIIGVQTGLIFGSYTYGEILGFRIMETPLLIGLNWVFVIAGGYALASKIFTTRFSKILFTGLLAVAFDIILEPVAISLGYWKWEGDTIPLQNFIAWFILAVIFGLLADRMRLKFTHRLATEYFLIQTLFFGILNFTM